ncbi:MAG: hypothetical protein GY811_12195 [Myxococcales bacterium]|nr:hypothetical protein [Myxococcales bacterium]
MAGDVTFGDVRLVEVMEVEIIERPLTTGSSEMGGAAELEGRLLKRIIQVVCKPTDDAPQFSEGEEGELVIDALARGGERIEEHFDRAFFRARVPRGPRRSRLQYTFHVADLSAKERN